MADYHVDVVFYPKGDDTYYVTAYPYPVPGHDDTVKNWETVTWTAKDEDGNTNLELQVGFEFAYNLSPLPSNPKPVGPMGPFESMLRWKNQVTGRLSPDGDVYDTYWRYLCIFFRNGQRAEWKPNSPGESDGGGVDTHRPPPAG